MNDTAPRVHVAAVSDIAAVIRDTRRRRGLTQLELAHAVGVTRQSVVNLETGRANPTLATVLATLQALGLRLHVTPDAATHHLRTVTDHADARVTPATHATQAAVGAPAPVDLDAVLDAVRVETDA